MTEFCVACSEYELFQSLPFIDFWSCYDLSIIVMFVYELSTYSLTHIRTSIVRLSWRGNQLKNKPWIWWELVNYIVNTKL